MSRMLVALAVVCALSGSSLIAQDETDKPVLVLKYGDGKADGKKSIAGAGEMIEFNLPSKGQQLKGIRVHGARYGYHEVRNSARWRAQERSHACAWRAVPDNGVAQTPRRRPGERHQSREREGCRPDVGTRC